MVNRRNLSYKVVENIRNKKLYRVMVTNIQAENKKILQ
jgi:hypothetical protein